MSDPDVFCTVPLDAGLGTRSHIQKSPELGLGRPESLLLPVLVVTEWLEESDDVDRGFVRRQHANRLERFDGREPAPERPAA